MQFNRSSSSASELRRRRRAIHGCERIEQQHDDFERDMVQQRCRLARMMQHQGRDQLPKGQRSSAVILHAPGRELQHNVLLPEHLAEQLFVVLSIGRDAIVQYTLVYRIEARWRQ